MAFLGDSKVGKTSLMVKYVNNDYNPTYEQTKGVAFMERNIQSGTTDVKFSIYDLGGAREFEEMLSLTTNDAVAVVYLFDLSNKESLESLKKWHSVASESNQNAIPVVVGTKYDLFIEQPKGYQNEIHDASIEFARSINGSVIFTSTSDSINVQKVFKILISKAFDLQISIPQITNVGEPILLYNL